MLPGAVGCQAVIGRQACYYDFNCPQILAKDISAQMPKEIRIHLAVRERVYWWIRPVEGTTMGTVEVWFTPDP